MVPADKMLDDVDRSLLYRTDAYRRMEAELEFDEWLNGIDLDDHPTVDEAFAPLGDTVDADGQCPRCHENRIDHLVWQDDEVVKCATCGYRYTPGEAQ